MKYIITYQEHNEGIKKSIIGAGLAGSLLFGSPAISQNKVSTSQSSQAIDINKTNNIVSKLSNIRSGNLNDVELESILDEIKNNLHSRDSSKFIELFNKLYNHIESKYDYKIPNKKIEELNQSSIGGMSLFVILGWMGSICLAICGVPQAWMSYKDKHSHGISWAFLLLWAFGELFALGYVYNKLDAPLLLNYSINILIVGLILYYKIKPSVDRSEI